MGHGVGLLGVKGYCWGEVGNSERETLKVKRGPYSNRYHKVIYLPLRSMVQVFESG